MRVLALLTARNEARYVGHCLDHLIRQGCEVAFIDHGSSDGTREIAERRLGHGVVRIDDQPWTGSFELVEQLRWKERVAGVETADWYLHVDADEVKEPPSTWSSLHEALADVARAGFNAVDFDEFVFVPTIEDPDFTDRDYVADMRWYYHYEPDSPDRWRINAWRGGVPFDLASSGGHHVMFDAMRVYPRPFVMRHYPVLSEAHADEKYANRTFAPAELAKSWHSDRARYRTGRHWLRARSELRELPEGAAPDPRMPWALHPFLDVGAGPRRVAVRPDPECAERRSRLREFRDRHDAHIPPIAPPTARGPLWSVVLPVHNAAPEHLSAVLASILDQDLGPDRMEIIVLDDASDVVDVRALVDQHGRGRVRYERNVSALGLPGNWNRGIDLATGELVHVLHQDDKVLPGFYERLGRPLADDAQLVGAYCRTSGIDERGVVQWTQTSDRSVAGVVDRLLELESDLHRMLCPALVVRRSAYEELGGYRTDMGYCTDWDFTKRLAALGPVWFEPLPLAQWRTHDAQASTRYARSGEDLAERVRSIDDSLCLLPTQVAEAVDVSAMHHTLAFTVKTLEQHVKSHDLEATLAQARQLVAVLEGRSSIRVASTAVADRNVAADELTAAHRRIEQLEAQIVGWIQAVRIARMSPNPADRNERTSDLQFGGRQSSEQQTESEWVLT